MKKLISILLLLSMLAGVVACTDSKDNPETSETKGNDESQKEEIETTDEPSLPELNCDGDDLVLLYRQGSWGYSEDYVYVDVEDGEVLNDSIFARNRDVSEKFNINIVGKPSATVADDINLAVSAQDDSYDAGWEIATDIANLSSGGYLYDILSIPNINIEAPYWDTNCARELTIGGKLFFGASDISMSTLGGVRLLIFNKKIITDNNMADPYDMIFSSGWTLENVMKMIEQVHNDLNGDGKMTGEDQFGLLREDGEQNGNIIYFLKGSNIPYTVPDEEGMPTLNINNEKTIKVFEICNSVLNDRNCTITYEDASVGADTTGFNHIFAYCRGALFTTDHFLFVQTGIDDTVVMRNMASDYGFAPNPKFDDNQEGYFHGTDLYITMMCIPSTVEKIDELGTILEYMAWKSSKTVFPAYYDITVKVKRAKDERDVEVCDIVKNSIRYELSDEMNWGISGVLWSSFTKGNFSSVYEKKQKMINNLMQKTIKAFEAME